MKFTCVFTEPIDGSNHERSKTDQQDNTCLDAGRAGI